MDYELKGIILNYFTSVCDEEIQTAITKYEDVVNGDEKIREKLSVELDRVLRDTIDAVSSIQGEDTKKFLTDLLEYLYETADMDELVTYIDWE